MLKAIENDIGVRVERMLVTPEIAEEWLRLNVENRPLAKHQVARLATVMQRHEFVFNGDCIRFGKDGFLKDGQHRLTACVVSGCAFETLVVWGLDSDAFNTIDVFIKPRGVGDILGLQGQKHANAVAATVKSVYNFCNLQGFFDGGAASNKLAFTPKTCIEILRKRPAITQAAIDVQCAKPCRVFPSGALTAALLYLFRSVDFDLAEDFFNVLYNGSSDTQRAFNVLRETLIARRLSSTQVKKTAAASLAIRAWNAEYSGRKVKILRFVTSDEFPRITGINYDKLSNLIGMDV